jgi:hypothetical protein
MRQSRSKAQRRPQRHSIRLACQVVRERDFRLIADRLTNLSVSGALVTPADPVVTGEALIVSFQLPGSSAFIDVDARVSRVLHGRRPGEYTRALGIVFSTLSEEQRLLLEAELLLRPATPLVGRTGRRSWMAGARRLAAVSGFVADPLSSAPTPIPSATAP